jgi:hypothetical protein
MPKYTTTSGSKASIASRASAHASQISGIAGNGHAGSPGGGGIACDEQTVSRLSGVMPVRM